MPLERHISCPSARNTTERLSADKDWGETAVDTPETAFDNLLLRRYGLVMASTIYGVANDANVDLIRGHILCSACNNNKLPQGQEHTTTTFLAPDNAATTYISDITASDWRKVFLSCRGRRERNNTTHIILDRPYEESVEENSKHSHRPGLRRLMLPTTAMVY